MSDREIICCPKCKQKLGVPSESGTLKVSCPTCGESFSWDKVSGISSKNPIEPSLPKSKKSKVASKRIAIIAAVILIAVIVYFTNTDGWYRTGGQTNRQDKDVISNRSQIDSARPVIPTTSPKWITISYLDLLDKNAITHTGDTVGAALQDTRNRGIVQPFVDKYSYLLQPSIEMTLGRDPIPYRNVIDFYPVATKQPAWVAIFRNGRIFTTADSNNHARFFLLGDNPETAYKTNYSLIRHCLRALLPKDGSNLFVEVFAYKNNYRSSELELNLDPYTLKASSFSAPKGTVPLDLAGLEDFFNKKGQLEGAKLDAGLTLYAQKGGDETLASYPVSLADFAVAYRAAFHAGDNDAFEPVA